MNFTDEQLDALSAPLTTDKVKTNPRGFDYIEGWHAIAEANRIFGFGNWDRTVAELRQLGEPREVDGKQRVGYMARVRITVRAGDDTVTRDGCGYGSGIDRDLGQAHESALKEAETDAMKRALMTFGNPFGLALYDKARENVAPPESAFVTASCNAIQKLKTPEACAAWWKANVDALKGATEAERNAVVLCLKKHKEALTKPPFDDQIPFGDETKEAA